MKPYYDEDGITIFQGDAGQVLGTDLPLADAVVTDPPYGETSFGWDQWPATWVHMIEVSSMPTASMWCFGSMRMFLDHAADFANWRLAQDIVWEKPNGSSFAADRFKRVHEHALHWYRGSWSLIYNDPARQRHFGPAKHVPSRRGTERAHTGAIGEGYYLDDGTRLVRSVVKAAPPRDGLHPTQKPVALVEMLVHASCPPDGLVLDPFMGSGSTLRAAKDLRSRVVTPPPWLSHSLDGRTS